MAKGRVKLQRGGLYLIDHKRKGAFVARMNGPVEGDDVDPQFLEMDIPAWPGSGQERMANPGVFVRDTHGRKFSPPVARKNIRPSLVLNITAIGKLSTGHPSYANAQQIKRFVGLFDMKATPAAIDLMLETVGLNLEV